MCKKETKSGCRKKRDVTPADCPPEQVRECHSDQRAHPCGTDPSECSPEQVRECHGSEADHPCERE